MKGSGAFNDQFSVMKAWFRDWSECEQTVALYSLIKKLTIPQAKFLNQVLQQSLADCQDVTHLQNRANDEAFISNLPCEDKGKALLQLLPLLQTGNDKAKNAYLKLISDILVHSKKSGGNLEESRQLLSYLLIHPAMTSVERSQLYTWMEYLGESQSAHNHCIDGLGPTSNGRYSRYSVFANPSLPTQFQDRLGNECNITASRHSGSAAASSACMTFSHQPVRMAYVGDCVSRDLMSNGHRKLNVLHSYPLLPDNEAGVSCVMLHPSLSAPPPHHHITAISVDQPPPPILPAAICTVSGDFHTPLYRTPSVVMPPVCLPMSKQSYQKAVTDWLQMHASTSNAKAVSPQHLVHGMPGLSGTCRSPTVAEHAPLSPQSSVTSSGSGCSELPHAERVRLVCDSFFLEGSGMRDVAVWLKSLRLHKYSHLFRQMTYEDMLSLTDERLETQLVTKGARHKIIISIKKLRERQQELRIHEKRIVEGGGSVKEVLHEMKSMLNTPIKPYHWEADLGARQSQCPVETEVAEGNLPGQFIRLMGKVCTQLLTASLPEGCSLQLYFQLIDKCLQHEAFSYRQKSLLSSWKQQALKICQPLPKKYDRRYKGWDHGLPLNSLSGRVNSSPWLRSTPCPVSSNQHWSFGSRRSLISSAANYHDSVQCNSSVTASSIFPCRLDAMQPLTRTLSAPMQSAQSSLPHAVQPTSPEVERVTDTEINARLDSLCLSMTEHALGGDVSERKIGF